MHHLFIIQLLMRSWGVEELGTEVEDDEFVEMHYKNHKDRQLFTHYEHPYFAKNFVLKSVTYFFTFLSVIQQ